MKFTKTNLFEKLCLLNLGLARTFPDGQKPFQILSRLMEECGELAEQVHIFEKSGVKYQKHGKPDPTKLAREIQDAILCVLQLADYYDIHPQLEKSIQQRLQRYTQNGTLAQEDYQQYGMNLNIMSQND